MLAGAVISVRTLEERLAGVAQVVVGRKAVVTPAARDLLKQHNITISRSADAAAAGKATLAVAVSETSLDAAGLKRLIAPLAAGIEPVTKTGLTAAVAELADAVVKQGRLGLLLCGKPQAACCLANRRPGLRAAVARDRDEVAQAVGSLGVNLLVVDPARRSLFELGQMVKQFFSGRPGPVSGLAPATTRLTRTRQTRTRQTRKLAGGTEFWIPPPAKESTMRIGKVIGNVTLSRCHPSLAGASYRVVVPLSLDNLLGRAPADAEPLVVCDPLAAGHDDLITFTEGREATQPYYPDEKPIDAYNAALLDAIQLENQP